MRPWSCRRKCSLGLICMLMQMPPHVTNITWITQVTFASINMGLLVNNRWLDLAHFQLLFDLVTNKCGLDGHIEYSIAQIHVQSDYSINHFQCFLFLLTLFFTFSYLTYFFVLYLYSCKIFTKLKNA